MTYCIIPPGLGDRTMRALERYAHETDVVVVVEGRNTRRRARGDRRVGHFARRPGSPERRSIQNADGRRVADRRAAMVPVAAPRQLPRRLRSLDRQIRFMEALEISREHVEDVDMARLVVRIQSGEEELFRALYDQWFDRVYAFARATLERSVLAELATSDVFADVDEALPHYDCSERFRSWFSAIVCRRLQEHLIVLHGPEALLDEGHLRAGAQPPHAVPSYVKDADLQVLISLLPLAQRQVVLLRYLMGLSQTEVASITDRSADAVADYHALALAEIAERQVMIGTPSEASSLRFAMARRHRSARVLQSRRLALTPG